MSPSPGFASQSLPPLSLLLMLDVDSVVVTEFNLYLHPPHRLGSNRKVTQRFQESLEVKWQGRSRRIATAGTSARSFQSPNLAANWSKNNLIGTQRAPEYPQLVAEPTLSSPHFPCLHLGRQNRIQFSTRLN